MPWLRHFALFLVFVTALFTPAAAGAFSSTLDANAQARVGVFEVAAGTFVGASTETSPGLHEGIGVAYDENASGYRFAAGGATRALPAARQIEAAWGASTYRHGGLMNGLEHIMYRHSADSGFAHVSRYASGTTGRNIVGYIDEALRYGTVTPNGAGYMIEHNLGRVIGTNIAGDAASSIRVFVRDGVIQTAFPF